MLLSLLSASGIRPVILMGYLVDFTHSDLIGKWLGMASTVWIRGKDHGTIVWWLFHHTRVSKFFHQSLFALDSCKCHATDLVAVESLPATTHVFSCELHHGLGTGKVDKGVAYVATIAKVHAQIDKVVLAVNCVVEHIQQHLLGVFVGDVAYHASGAVFQSRVYCVVINVKVDHCCC